MDRETWAKRLEELLERPVRWASPTLAGAYDGWERTLDVFKADAAEQLGLYRRMRPVREELEADVGGAVIVIFHTRKESARLYGIE